MVAEPLSRSLFHSLNVSGPRVSSDRMTSFPLPDRTTPSSASILGLRRRETTLANLEKPGKSAGTREAQLFHKVLRFGAESIFLSSPASSR